jgi:hypothetical protein
LLLSFEFEFDFLNPILELALELMTGLFVVHLPGSDPHRHGWIWNLAPKVRGDLEFEVAVGSSFQ